MSSAANKIPLEYEKLWVKHSPYWRHWKYQYMRTLSSKSELIENDLFKTISKGIFLVYTVAAKIWVIFSKTRKFIKIPEKIDFLLFMDSDIFRIRLFEIIQTELF